MVSVMDMIPMSKFKGTWLEVLEEVRRTGTPALVTRGSDPIAEIMPLSRPAATSSWLGAARGTGGRLGDLVEPVADTGRGNRFAHEALLSSVVYDRTLVTTDARLRAGSGLRVLS